MTCPVCLFTDLPYPPSGYNICPCCGTEFGNDDAFLTHEELRYQWIDSGARWHSRVFPTPAGWDAVSQLSHAALNGRSIFYNLRPNEIARVEVILQGPRFVEAFAFGMQS